MKIVQVYTSIMIVVWLKITTLGFFLKLRITINWKYFSSSLFQILLDMNTANINVSIYKMISIWQALDGGYNEIASDYSKLQWFHDRRLCALDLDHYKIAPELVIWPSWIRLCIVLYLPSMFRLNCRSVALWS